MNDKLYIDGIDAYEKWGVFVVQGGWNNILSWPPLKAPATNDWPEDDGVEVDLDSPQLDTMSATISFACTGVYGNMAAFVNHLADGSYHEFDSPSIGRKLTLRMEQMPNLSGLKFLECLSIKFANDYPLKGYTYQEPDSDISAASDYLIDNRPFTDYGCRILRGSLATIRKAADVKRNLLVNIKSNSGAAYDSGAVCFKGKDIKLNCLMRADTLAELWANYDALLYDLIRPQLRQLYVADLEQTFLCHYKSAAINAFYPTGKIWLDFTITLTCTGSTRLTDDLVFADENGVLISGDEQATEEETLVNLQPNQ